MIYQNSARYAVAIISILFISWCTLISVRTFLKNNEVVYHLSGFYLLVYAAIYTIFAPFGVAGILGALHRKKTLIRGFLYQYWVGLILFTAINIVNVLLAHKWEQKTRLSCQQDNHSDAFCAKKVKDTQLASLVFTSMQSITMGICGIILLICGRREFQDIKIDEETTDLLEKQIFASKNDNGLLSVPQKVYREPDDAKSDYTYWKSNNYPNKAEDLLSRKPSFTSHALSRQPTNTKKINVQQSRGLNRSATTASHYYSTYSTRSGPPIQTMNFGPVAVPKRAFSTRTYQTPHFEQNSLYRAAPAAASIHQKSRPSSPNFFENKAQCDDYNNYWQPKVAKTLASDLTRKGLY
ncbi:hypothetical protein G9A89_015848 [Geosiphon pyriformis]|nr:hypothetical protein G9A89_015848 [Geosiphon pyriformis]